ncbi:MAG TPA: YbaK/EbsC family protein [Actinomycetota bacterium]|nr:YbaK/EbsC family protein [Actinomycetota bacterium]
MRTSVDVHNYLVERDIPHELFLARGRLRSPEQIALVLDLPQDEVGKVVIYETGRKGVAAVLPVGCRALASRVQQAVDKPDLRRATIARSAEITDFLPESVPPAGLPAEIAMVVDESMDRDDVLYFAGGEPRAILKIRGTDLIKATEAVVAPIASKRAA